MKKRILTAAAFVVCLVLLMGIVDFLRVRAFEKPIFARPSLTVDDGGSGIYRGLGYTFAIEGNFLPEAEHPGVVKFEGYILGNLVSNGVRD